MSSLREVGPDCPLDEQSAKPGSREKPDNPSEKFVFSLDIIFLSFKVILNS